MINDRELWIKLRDCRHCVQKTLCTKLFDNDQDASKSVTKNCYGTLQWTENSDNLANILLEDV